MPGLIKSFKTFKKRYGTDLLLVIGGKVDKRFIDLEGEIKKNKLIGEVILTDSLTREEVSVLYKEAKALIFVSFYEGFGLPILEAQIFGIPVLTANISSLPEVGGKGALYVDPYNPEEVAEGIKKIVFNDNFKGCLIENGYENLKRFSWERSVRKLIDLFHGVNIRK